MSPHCKRDSMRNRNITRQDIITGLETGEIKRKPEWDNDHQNWKYRVEGFDSDGDDITMITVIIEADLKLVIVTVW